MSNRPIRRLVWVGIAVLAVGVAVGLALLLGDGGDTPPLAISKPRIVSAPELREIAGADPGAPIYWLGKRGDGRYELTENAAGDFYLRYVPPNRGPGGRRAEKYVTVASYPSKDGVAALGRPGSKLGQTDDGAVLLIDPGSPRNAHLAYPGADFQLEVFSPVPGEALRLAARGDVRPVR